MLGVRVIPTLLLQDGGLVKGERFTKHRYVGDPINAVKIFNTKEVDEIVFFDISARSAGRGPDFSMLSDIASEAFMPMAYGGGVSTVEDAEKLFNIGFEKVVLNSAAVDLGLVSRLSKQAGSQSIVVSIDAKKSLLGKYQVFTRCGTHNEGLSPDIYAKRLQDAGAGELIICSIDREGTGKGYDLGLVAKVAGAVTIPVVASGGAGALQHLRAAVEAGASAVAAGSMFVFHGPRKAVLITYPQHELLEKMFKGVA